MSAERLAVRQNTGIKKPAVLAPLKQLYCGADIMNRAALPRSWIVPELIPDRTVSSIGGDGGLGKSQIALQLAVAVATGRPWLGMEVAAGPALYLSAEDPIDEIRRRLDCISRRHKIERDDLSGLHILDQSSGSSVLAIPDRGELKPTPLFEELKAFCDTFRPKLLVLDALADIFGGNEIDRVQVRSFISIFRTLAIENDLAVVLLTHPSNAGKMNGSGISGSTAWNNSVRSRLHLQAGRKDDSDDVRILTVPKANYSRKGRAIRIFWDDGTFERDDEATSRMPDNSYDAEADAVFLRMLKKFNAIGQVVSDTPSKNYAPAVFAREPDAEHIGKLPLEKAMKRLIGAGDVVMRKVGSSSKPRRSLVIA
ncbi:MULTISPECIES: AAA family ATPase [unclassified Chelatococcus]|uniref:AAA family ATPase n=1 Tax=unclassified Chelatococcus TaxID=2638111 RepID=UPI001BCBD7E7|nr:MULTISPECIES: AAA family ATPase [unclassified Chelatococcus]MBS7698687.1 AAA family ATPase [Chelatococcus sp. YT9]MBX3554731.1 AAA family ATPase [Chelatococcus sp.]